MKFILLFGSIAAPTMMLAVQQRREMFHLVFQLTAIAAALIFGNIAAMAIHQIIVDNTVFMTNIHGLFLNPVFLTAGAYLGVYLVYAIAKSMLSARQPRN